MLKIFLIFISLSCASQIQSQNTEIPSPIYFIYDASGSMWGELDGTSKMKTAANVLTTTVNSLNENQKLGLVAYGHRKKGDCQDVEFLVELDTGTKKAVIDKINAIKPLGKTPLAFSALQVIDKLRDQRLKSTIILITDGIESCGGNICDVIKKAKEAGIDFKLHIIGFGIKNEDTAQLKCAAEAGNGSYFDAENAEGLSEVLIKATSETVDEEKENFSVYAVKNNVAIDAWVKAYKDGSNEDPIAVRTYKDTAFFYLPAGKYSFEATPLEGSDVKSIKLSDIESFDEQMVHETISFDGGKLALSPTNNGENWDCMIKVYDLDGNIAASDRSYDRPAEIEVNPGVYKISIQALRIEGIHTYTEFEDILVEAAGITPIAYEFESANLDIYTKLENEHIDNIIKIVEINSGKTVGSSRTYAKGAKFLLNPGKYEIRATPLGKHKDKEPKSIMIELKKGEHQQKELNY